MNNYFIVHASEDKKDFVKKLADKMIIHGAEVFYDEYSINLGDSLVESINKGIQEANIGVIIFSPNFFKKNWPIKEFNSIFNKFVYGDNTKIIPIYHNITYEEVTEKYPIVNDVVGISSTIEIIEIVEKLLNQKQLPKGHQFIVDYSKKPNFSYEKSWTIILAFSLLKQINPKVPKIIFETGFTNDSNNRVRIYLENNEKLKYQIIDNIGTEISLSYSIKNWKISNNKPSFNDLNSVVATYNKEYNIMELFINGFLEKSIQLQKKLDLPNTFYVKGKSSFGCSIEQSNPASIFIFHTQIYSAFATKDTIHYYLNDYYLKLRSGNSGIMMNN